MLSRTCRGGAVPKGQSLVTFSDIATGHQIAISTKGVVAGEPLVITVPKLVLRVANDLYLTTTTLFEFSGDGIGVFARGHR